MLSQLSYRPKTKPKRVRKIAAKFWQVNYGSYWDSNGSEFSEKLDDSTLWDEMRIAMRTVFAVMCCIVGCSAYDNVALLELQEVTPSKIGPRDDLILHGHGFPLGQRPSVTLRGELFQPGHVPIPFETTLRGVVDSESLVQVPVDDEFIGRVGGRATFRGVVRVAFRSFDGRRDVYAEHSLHLDFLPETNVEFHADMSMATPHEFPNVLRADAFGIELASEGSEDVGVRVISVASKSFAAEQGMQSGDIVVALDGVQLHHRYDFVADPSKTNSTVIVQRNGLPGVYELRWPHVTLVDRASSVDLIVFFMMGLLFGWTSPARLFFRVSGNVSGRRWLADTACVVSFAALLVWVPLVRWTALWVMCLGLIATTAAYRGAMRQVIVGFAFVVASVVVLMGVAQTSSATVLIEQQKEAFNTWWLLRSPAVGMVFLPFLHGLRACDSHPRMPNPLYGAMVAVLGATFFFGSWWITAMAWVEFLVLVGKAVAILAVSRCIHIHNRIACVFIGFAILWVTVSAWFDFPESYPQWGAWMVGFAFAAIGSAIMTTRRASVTPTV